MEEPHQVDQMSLVAPSRWGHGNIVKDEALEHTTVTDGGLVVAVA